MFIYLLIQTLQCEQKHIIHELILKRDSLEIQRPKFETADSKAFCRLLIHQSIHYFFAQNDYDVITNDIQVSC